MVCNEPTNLSWCKKKILEMLKFPQPAVLKKDSGFAWLVLSMTAISCFAHYGFANSVTGGLTIVQKDYFNIDLQLSSLIGSAYIACMHIFGPPISIAIKKYGVRCIQLLGSVCIVVSLLLTTLATEAWQAILLFSFLAGLGTCMTYSASCQILVHHFDKHLNLAFSLSVSGAFVGCAIWPVFFDYLLDKFHYPKAMGIVSAIQIIHFLTGLCFFVPKSECETLKTKVGVATIFPTNVDSQETLENKLNEVHFAENDHNLSGVESETENKPGQLKKDFIQLSKSPYVWLYVVSGLVWTTLNVATSVLINSFMVSTINLTVDEAATGVTLIGVGRLLACIFISASSCIKYDIMMCHFLMYGLMCLATIIQAFSNCKVMYYVVALIYGIGHGGTTVTFLPITNMVWGARLQPLLVGLHLMGDGIGSLAIPPLFVYISKETGGQYGFLAMGCFGLVGLSCLFPLFYHKRKTNLEVE